MNRPVILLLLVLSTPLLVAGLSGGRTAIASPTSRMAAQSNAGEGCDDLDACTIWALDATAGNFTRIFAINVCNKTFQVSAEADRLANEYDTLAADPASNALLLGSRAGQIDRYPISIFPGPPMGLATVGALVSDAHAFTEGFESSLFAGALNLLHDPLTALGAGPGDYTPNESDMVFDHGSDAPLPLLGSIKVQIPFNLPNGQVVQVGDHLARIGRFTGDQLYLRPAPLEFHGLAVDGNDQLFAIGATNSLMLVSGWSFPQLGAGSIGYNPMYSNYMSLPMWYGNPTRPVNIVDMASSPRCSSGDAPPDGDFGDAPDSSSHLPQAMSAYGSVTAAFPTVYDPATGAPPGPAHWANRSDVWLGAAASAETDADLMPDADGPTNISPTLDIADRDGADDGLAFPLALPHCQMSQVDLSIEVVGTDEIARYLNLWIDFDRSGDWGQTQNCVDPTTSLSHTVGEWAVQNQVLVLNTGTHPLSIPFRALLPPGDAWLRVSVAEAPASHADGRGPAGGYEFGETEDYRLLPLGGGQFTADP